MGAPVASAPITRTEPASRGVLFAFGAYGLWGVFPLYFQLLSNAGAWEIIAHRAVWTCLCAVVGIAVARQWYNLRAVLARPRVVAMIAAGGVVVVTNWGIYVWAVINDHVVDASLGYYINPLVTVALAVLVLHERLSRLQVVALSIGATAVIVLVITYRQVPWVALGLAFSFGTYALVKNRAGRHATPLVGLGLETSVVVPFAVAFIVWLQVTGRGTLTGHGGGHASLLVLTGLVTAVPLLFFAAAAGRVPLSTLGLIQYVTPTCALLIGVVLDHEPMSPARWIGFGLVWCALIVLAWDGLTSSRTPAPAPVGASEGSTDPAPEPALAPSARPASPSDDAVPAPSAPDKDGFR